MNPAACFQGASDLLHRDAAPERNRAQPKAPRGSSRSGSGPDRLPLRPGWLGLKGRARVEYAGSSRLQQLPPKL